MRLTYLELLEAVKEGKQPKKVKVGSIVYSWDGCEYVQNADTRQSLSDRLPNWATKAQTTADFIEEVVDILTGEEKEYLRAVIKPFRKKIDHIEKNRHMNGGYEYISIVVKNPTECIDFPWFDTDSMYAGLIVDKPYKLEELDL